MSYIGFRWDVYDTHYCYYYISETNQFPISCFIIVFLLLCLIIFLWLGQLFLVLQVFLQRKRLNMVSWPWECFRVNYKWFYIILLSVRIICDVILSMRHDIEATSILVLLLTYIQFFFIIKKVSRFNFYHNIITIFALLSCTSFSNNNHNQN